VMRISKEGLENKDYQLLLITNIAFAILAS